MLRLLPRPCAGVVGRPMAAGASACGSVPRPMGDSTEVRGMLLGVKERWSGFEAPGWRPRRSCDCATLLLMLARADDTNPL